MSLTKVGKVIELFYSTNDIKLNTVELSLDSKGIIGDKHYDKNIQRSVLIASKYSYKLAQTHDIEIPYGTLGENILIDYNPYHLQAGARLMIGNLVLEISQKCTLCKSLAKEDNKLPKILKDDRGIFAKVIKNGTISKNDIIYLIDNQTS